MRRAVAVAVIVLLTSGVARAKSSVEGEWWLRFDRPGQAPRLCKGKLFGLLDALLRK